MANNVLELKGKRFIQAAKKSTGGGANINGCQTVTSEHLNRLKNKIIQIRTFWLEEKKTFEGVLISVLYNKIAAKSNRISGLFNGQESNNAIVGAKLNKNRTKHIITYFLNINDLENSCSLLSKADIILNKFFEGWIDKNKFIDNNKFDQILFDNSFLSKSKFKEIIADVSYIDDFEIEKIEENITQSIITLYDTKTDTKKLLKELGIDILSSRILDNNTVFLDKNQVEVLFEKAPYLVSMATEDISKLSPEEFIQTHKEQPLHIANPTIEPTIGVIDTLFDTQVYFSNWVEYYDMVDDNLPKNSNDYKHGTAVSSIIVDGPKLNPWLDDGCGRFKVRHFGVAIGSQFSSFTIIKKIKKIIADNKDIKVWNISLGSNQEVNDNFISAEAAILDKIQYENDIIFVVAGTNKPNKDINKIGSPADSINSLVVNAVTKDRLSTDYARKGIVLSFFAKPDVSYYGGSKDKYIRVCEPLGEAKVSGTSFAAPWIARKLSYLIDILGINRELAKAMIIDSARSWHNEPSISDIALYGHGIVPIRIEDIIKTKDDEIKFLVSDISEKWNTYNYHFPIPLHDDKYPYIAKATMCYFPKCNRTQGVDYTNTELNLHFGRINNQGKIQDIKGDKQNQEIQNNEEVSYLLETDARTNFRKWDNVKYIVEKQKERTQSRKSYENKNWGMEVKTNNRLDPKDGEGVRFGVVITLKEINGINRIDEFIRNCHLNGWLVNELDTTVKVDIHQAMNQDIEFN